MSEFPENPYPDHGRWTMSYPNGFDETVIHVLSDLFQIDKETAQKAYETLGDVIETPVTHIWLPNASYSIRVDDNHGLPKVTSQRVGNIVIEVKKLLKLKTLDPALIAAEYLVDGITPELLIVRVAWAFWNGTKSTLPPHASVLFVGLARDADLPCTTQEAYERVKPRMLREAGLEISEDWFQTQLTLFARMQLINIDADILTIPEKIVWEVA